MHFPFISSHVPPTSPFVSIYFPFTVCHFPSFPLHSPFIFLVLSPSFPFPSVSLAFLLCISLACPFISPFVPLPLMYRGLLDNACYEIQNKESTTSRTAEEVLSERHDQRVSFFMDSSVSSITVTTQSLSFSFPSLRSCYAVRRQRGMI